VAFGARWDGVDLKERTWTIKAKRMKSGRAHRVPLSPRAVAIIGIDEFIGDVLEALAARLADPRGDPLYDAIYDEVRRRMVDPFRANLEVEGKITICEAGHALFEVLVAGYALSCSGDEGEAERSRRQDDRLFARARDAARLANELEADPDREFYFLEVGEDAFLPERTAIDLPIRLRAYADQFVPGPRRKGRPYNSSDDLFLKQAAWTFHILGGRVASSENGPFMRLIKHLWTAVPPWARRGRDATVLVRRARELRQELKEHVRGIPQREAGKPIFVCPD
jgi:hypothetical protein